MRTEDLIAKLAAEGGPAPGATLARSVALGLGAGAVVTGALFLGLLGPRPGLGGALAQPMVAAKTLLPLVLAPVALVLALRSARPAAQAGRMVMALRAVPLAAAALVGWALVATPEAARWAAFVGHSIHICLPAITLLSLPMLAGLLAALRRGAPVRPAHAGALAGLAAAGFATALYSLFCTEDSPLFYGVWYSAAIVIVTALGALAGARALRG